MIWCRVNMMYNFKDAEAKYPQNFSGVEGMYNEGVIAWLEVKPEGWIEPAPATAERAVATRIPQWDEDNMDDEQTEPN